MPMAMRTTLTANKVPLLSMMTYSFLVLHPHTVAIMWKGDNSIVIGTCAETPHFEGKFIPVGTEEKPVNFALSLLVPIWATEYSDIAHSVSERRPRPSLTSIFQEVQTCLRRLERQRPQEREFGRLILVRQILLKGYQYLVFRPANLRPDLRPSDRGQTTTGGCLFWLSAWKGRVNWGLYKISIFAAAIMIQENHGNERDPSHASMASAKRC